MRFLSAFVISVVLVLIINLTRTTTLALNVVLAGGTGPVGTALASKLYHDPNLVAGDDRVTILCRNAFLARAPARVTEQFGWVGQSFLEKHAPTVQLRDWDGGDLLEIVGQDFLGWQQDALTNADVIVHLVGGFTEQRVMACERLVRESYAISPKSRKALHITVSPTDKDLDQISPLASMPLKIQRLKQCEEMVQSNCANYKCLRLEANRLDQGVHQIYSAIQEWAAQREQ